MKKKIHWNKVTWYSRLGAIILFVGIVPALTFYIGQSLQETQDLLKYERPQVVLSSSKHSQKIAKMEREAREQEILSQLINSWKTIAPKQIPKYPKPSVAFYGYPITMQFIGNNHIVLTYQDNYNVYQALFSYTNTGVFTYKDQYMVTKQLSPKASQWLDLYADTSLIPFSTYSLTTTRNGDGVLPSDWSRVDGR